MRAFLPVLLIPCCLFASACDSATPLVCTDNLVPAIEVEVRDAITGEAAADGAVGIATDRAFSDTLEVGFPGLVLTGAYERAGRYEVIVTKVGYKPWREGVRVERDACHVETVRLRADLER